MRDYLRDRPLLRFGIITMAGIATGGYLSIPSALCLAGHDVAASSIACGTALLLLLLSVLLRGKAMLSSLTLTAAAFAFGLFLITNNPAPAPTQQGRLAAVHDSGDRASRYRALLSSVYREYGLAGEEHAIVTAMTLGERQHVSRETRQYYNISGAGHVFALSGLHLGIIFMLLAFLLPTVRLPIASTAVQLAALWSYVLLVGFHASILRAAVMLTVYSLCRLASRKADPVSVLVIAALLLCVARPYWLFDAGFQMSFAAVLFIAIVCPTLRRMVPADCPWIARYVLDILSVSLAATLGTAPLIALYFHRVSLYSLLANIVVSPCALLVIALALLLLLCAGVATLLPPLALLPAAVGFLLSHVVHFLNTFLASVAALPCSSLDGIRLSGGQTVCLYVLLAALLGIARRLSAFCGQKVA